MSIRLVQQLSSNIATWSALTVWSFYKPFHSPHSRNIPHHRHEPRLTKCRLLWHFQTSGFPSGLDKTLYWCSKNIVNLKESGGHVPFMGFEYNIILRIRVHIKSSWKTNREGETLRDSTRSCYNTVLTYILHNIMELAGSMIRLCPSFFSFALHLQCSMCIWSL